MTRKRMKLGQMLLEAGHIDEFQLNSALSHQRNIAGGRLGASLVKLRYISEEDLLNFLAGQLNLPRIDPTRRPIASEILEYIPSEKAWEYKAVPVDRKELRGIPFLLVAMADPTNAETIDALQRMTGCRVRPAIAPESAIVEALVNHYGPLGAEEEDIFVEIDLPLDQGDEPSPDSPSQDVPAFTMPLSTSEEKFRLLLKILLDKGILTLQDFERLK